MALTVENLCGLMIRSKLHGPEAVKGLYQRYSAGRAAKGGLREFAKWLVAHRHLTEYQATLLSNGYTDNFFLGQYRILDRVGKGRFAGVYKAAHALGQTVAIKVLPPSKAKDPQLLARFEREAQIALQLNHPSVVRTFQLGESNGLHYIVMEYLEGETLDLLIRRRGPLPPKEAVRLAFLAALGLQHIHEKGLVHRDIKPGNLMLLPKPKAEENTLRSMIKILDIGLGRELFSTRERKFAADLTMEGMILGTPDYLAPEQARDAKRADIRADLYGLGCTLYHCLTGRPPFPDDNPVRQILRHATESPKPFTDFNLSIPDGLSRIVMKLMAKNPDQRFQTPSATADALKAFLAGVPEPPRAESPQLKTYLEWLQRPPPSADGAPPMARHAPPPSLPPPSAAKVLKHRRKSKLRSPIKFEDAALPSLDVELVPVPEAKLGGLPRDWAMIVIGALSGAIIVGGIWWWKWWLG